MLHLIFGRAGSGKTEYARALLAEKVRSGEGSIYFLVPEQYSFESEKALQRELKEKSLGVEVLSFTRLADRVQREYGGMAGRRLNESGRVLLMSQALARVADSLELYRRQTENGEFISLMLHMAQECKMCGVEPAKLLTVAQTMADGTLKSKTQEIGAVLTEYEALVSKSFLDPLDDLTRLKNQLAAHPFFAGAFVAVDSFKGFTAQEFSVLELVIAQSADCVVMLCTDSLDDPEHGAGLFSGVKKTARRLIELARRHHVAVAPPVTLNPGARFQTENLAAAERLLFRSGKPDVQRPDGSISLASALNPYEESQWIARTVLRMVQSGEYRCRDFAVIVRREEDYAGILDEMLRRYGIPYFMDMPRPVDDSPLMAFVISALECVCGGMEGDSLFRCLKTGLWGLSAEEIASLENYAFVWNVNRGGWLEEWEKSSGRLCGHAFGGGPAAPGKPECPERKNLHAAACAAQRPARGNWKNGRGGDLRFSAAGRSTAAPCAGGPSAERGWPRGAGGGSAARLGSADGPARSVGCCAGRRPFGAGARTAAVAAGRFRRGAGAFAAEPG